MSIMFSPIPNRTIVATNSATLYTADANGIIPNVATLADQNDLKGAGCILLAPVISELIGTIKGANFNASAAGNGVDQPVTWGITGKFRIRRITFTNASVSLTTAVGGLYTATARGGSAIVGSGQTYSALTGALLALDLTLALPNLVLASGTPLYLNLSTAQGAPATADGYIFGDQYS